MNNTVSERMKLFLCLAVFIAMVYPCAAAGKREAWKVVREQTIEHKTNVCGFETKDFGVTVGYAGETHWTTDGGANWPASEKVPALCRFGLDVIDASTAVSGGNSGIVISEDGCRTWKLINPSRYDNLSFAERQSGWLADKYRILSTSDGGCTWTELPLPKEKGAVSSISMVSGSTGYFIDDKGTLFRTDDGGATWSGKTVTVGNTKYEPFFGMCAVRFANAENGLVVVWAKIDGKPGWLSLSTKDGGAAWKTSVLDAPFVKPYISRDGKFLTMYDSATRKAVLYEKS